jgi:NAD(P)-dependent dehydrogenase (short-subunit alcohol dehydrogenase family)
MEVEATLDTRSGRIAGKVALVTGGASGLGAAIARRFSAEGATVLIADIDTAGAQAVARELGDPACALTLDVTDESSWVATFATAEQLFGRLDVLVNNAGITHYGTIESLDLSAFRRMLDIDLVGVFLGCKHVVPLMKRTGGSVINMSSMCSIRAQPEYSGYNAAKAGMTHLTKSVALHYAREGYGMRCNTIHPGVMETPILRKVMAEVDDPQALYAQWVSIHPIGRLGKPEEIGSLALYLASDEASFATGGEFVIDGGSSL